jgi:hypothetical protein
MKKLFLLTIISLLSSILYAQSAEDFVADTADVNTIDQIIDAYYAITNGPAGPRDWQRYRSLFKPEAQINAKVFSTSGKLIYVAGTLTDFIAGVDEYFKVNGYFETEIGRQVHQYQDIAQVFTAYDAKLATNQASYHRGMKSVQLVYDQNRWWILNIVYNNESRRSPIPNEMLFEKYQAE